MSVNDDFSTFCSNLRMASDTVDKIQKRYHRITKRININYRSTTCPYDNAVAEAQFKIIKTEFVRKSVANPKST